MFVVDLGGRERTAAAQIEFAANHRQRAAQGAGVREGSEIARAVVGFEAGESETRDWVVEVDLEQEESFVVAEGNVVARVKFFDEPAFKEEGFGLVFDDVDIEIVNGIDKGVEFQIPTHAAGGMEILGDAFAEVAGFADVNDGAEAILHQVDAGFVRQLAELVSDVVGRWHASSRYCATGRRGRKVARGLSGKVKELGSQEVTEMLRRDHDVFSATVTGQGG